MSEDSKKTDGKKELEQKTAERALYMVGPDGCVYRVSDLSENPFDKQYMQR